MKAAAISAIKPAINTSTLLPEVQNHQKPGGEAETGFSGGREGSLHPYRAILLNSKNKLCLHWRAFSDRGGLARKLKSVQSQEGFQVEKQPLQEGRESTETGDSGLNLTLTTWNLMVLTSKSASNTTTALFSDLKEESVQRAGWVLAGGAPHLGIIKDSAAGTSQVHMPRQRAWVN